MVSVNQRVWASRFKSNLIGCSPHVICKPSIIRRLIRCSLLWNEDNMAKRASDSPCASSAKNRKYAAKYQPEWAIQMDFICSSDKGAMFVYCSVQRARECILRWQVRCCSPFEVGKSRYLEERHEDTAADEILLRNFENDGTVHQCVNRRCKVCAIRCQAQSTIFGGWSFHEIGQAVVPR